jgi:hypothetical protein
MPSLLLDVMLGVKGWPSCPTASWLAGWLVNATQQLDEQHACPLQLGESGPFKHGTS